MISRIFKNFMIFIVNTRQSRFQYFYGIIIHLVGKLWQLSTGLIIKKFPWSFGNFIKDCDRSKGPNYQQNVFQDFCPNSKMSNQKNKGTFILTLLHYFFDLTSLEARAEILEKNNWYFGPNDNIKKDILKLTDL